MQNFLKTAQQARAATDLPHPVQYQKSWVEKMEINKEWVEGMKHRWQKELFSTWKINVLRCKVEAQWRKKMVIGPVSDTGMSTTKKAEEEFQVEIQSQNLQKYKNVRARGCNSIASEGLLSVRTAKQTNKKQDSSVYYPVSQDVTLKVTFIISHSSMTHVLQVEPHTHTLWQPSLL